MRSVVLIVLLAFMLTANSESMDVFVYNHLYENETYTAENVTWKWNVYYLVIIDEEVAFIFSQHWNGSFWFVESNITNILEEYYEELVKSNSTKETYKEVEAAIQKFEQTRTGEDECIDSHYDELTDSLTNFSNNVERINNAIEEAYGMIDKIEMVYQLDEEIKTMNNLASENLNLIGSGLCPNVSYDVTPLSEARAMLEQLKELYDRIEDIPSDAERILNETQQRKSLQPRIIEGTEEEQLMIIDMNIEGELAKGEMVILSFYVNRTKEMLANKTVTITFPNGETISKITDENGKTKLFLNESGFYEFEVEGYSLITSLVFVEEKAYEGVVLPYFVAFLILLLAAVITIVIQLGKK